MSLARLWGMPPSDDSRNTRREAIPSLAAPDPCRSSDDRWNNDVDMSQTDDDDAASVGGSMATQGEAPPPALVPPPLEWPSEPSAQRRSPPGPHPQGRAEPSDSGRGVAVPAAPAPAAVCVEHPDDADEQAMLEAAAAAAEEAFMAAGRILETEGTMDHDRRPYRRVPDTWPVYEALVLHVRNSALAPQTSLEDRSWGRFATTADDDPQAAATKRLLFLLARAVGLALSSASGDPTHLAPPGATAPQLTAAARRAEEHLAAAADLPVRRPPGVGGAVPAAGVEDPRLAELEQIVTAAPSLGAGRRVIAKPARSPGVFELSDSTVRDGDPILTRRISMVLEELLSPQGGETVGWRWWFLVHDPRLIMARWLERALTESRHLVRRRAETAARAAAAGRPPNPRLLAPIDAIEEPTCFQRAIDLGSYAALIGAYYSGGGGEGGDALAQSRPQLDSGSMQHGVAAPHAGLHPVRAFSPQVAMSMAKHQGVCEVQHTLANYVNTTPGQAPRLGAFVRPTRTVVYDAARLCSAASGADLQALHDLPLPTDHMRRRDAVVRQLMWRALRRSTHLLPLAMAAAVKKGDLGLAVALNEQPELWAEAALDRDTVRSTMRQAVTEQAIEQHELGNHNRGHNRGAAAADGYANKRRRLAAANADDLDLPDGDGDDDPFALHADRASPARSHENHAEAAEGDRGHGEGGGGGGGGDDDDDDAMDVLPPPPADGALGDPRNESMRNAAAAASDFVDLARFNLLRAHEVTGSALTPEDIVRSPLLRLRMENHFVLTEIADRYMPGTPEYRAAMDRFRTQGMLTFERVLATYANDPFKLSNPIRQGRRFILDLARVPNRTHAHEQAVAARAARPVHADPSLLLSALCEGSMAAAAAVPASVLSGPSPHHRGGFWFVWPHGAHNLTPYGNWRINMRHKCVMHYRCRPGEAPNLLQRMIWAQGVAAVFQHGLGVAVLLHGDGNTGKSYLLHCINRQAYPGQVEYHDNLTEKSFAIDVDRNDVLILIEEAPPRFVGQDEKGNVTAGDELIKTMLTRHQIVTSTLVIDDKGKRSYVKAMCRCMCSIMMATNLRIRMLSNGVKPAILRRFLTDHVTWSRNDVPLAAINSPMGPERNDTGATEFFHQLSIVNALCMLIEKLIEAKVLADVSTDVCSFHFSEYFEQVHRQCRVPKVDSSVREMLEQLCRQTCIRYAVHRVFFSETAATETRCELREGAPPDSRNPADWIPRRFELSMLLKVQPYLVVTEEMMVDVLTSSKSTYMPMTCWSVINVIADVHRHTEVVHRRRTRARQAQEETAAGRKRRRAQPNAGAAAVPDAPIGDGEAEDEFDATATAVAASAPPDDPQAIVTDLNYRSWTYADLGQAADFFSQESHGSVEPAQFTQVLLQLRREWEYHRDRNRPAIDRQHPDQYQMRWVETVGPNGQPERQQTLVYRHRLRSPVVRIESVPQAGDGGAQAGTAASRRRRARRSTAATGSVFESGPIQLSILVEYLEQERNDSIDGILRGILCYRGAQPRTVVSGCGVQDVFRPSDGHGHIIESAPAVMAEFMSTIQVQPNVRRLVRRYNLFPHSDVTDAFVNNQSLAQDGQRPPPWGDQSRDMNRRLQIRLGTDLDTELIREYWTRVGLDPRQHELPHEYAARVRAIYRREPHPTDDTGTSLPARLREIYPWDFQESLRAAPLVRQGFVIQGEGVDADGDADMADDGEEGEGEGDGEGEGEGEDEGGAENGGADANDPNRRAPPVLVDDFGAWYRQTSS